MDRKKEILQAAKNVMLKYGIRKTTLEDIAQECGIKKTALYYYFKSKNDVLQTMFSQTMNDLQQELSENIKAGRNTKEKLKIFMHKKLNIFREIKPFVELLHRENLPTKVNEYFHKEQKVMMEFDYNLIRKIIETGIAKSIIQVTSLDSLILMILGVTYGTGFSLHLKDKDIDAEKMFDDTINIIFKGISIKSTGEAK
jgi:AcrR family transcriptional regulator